MKASEENLVSGATARAELGRPGPPLGSTYFSAIKHEMGIKSRRVRVSEIRAWLRAHPNFKVGDVYRTDPNAPREECPTCKRLIGLLKTSAGKRLRRHKMEDGAVCPMDTLVREILN